MVARSSVEVKFRALAMSICELLWVRIILKDFKVNFEERMKLYCDNKAAISIAYNPVQHDRTKHVEVDRHFIKEKVEPKEVCLNYVPTKHQLTDVLTKGFNRGSYENLVSKLGMHDIYSPT